MSERIFTIWADAEEAVVQAVSANLRCEFAYTGLGRRWIWTNLGVNVSIEANSIVRESRPPYLKHTHASLGQPVLRLHGGAKTTERLARICEGLGINIGVHIRRDLPTVQPSGEFLPTDFGYKPMYEALPQDNLVRAWD